jgi:FixJ family two-component response regulator
VDIRPLVDPVPLVLVADADDKTRTALGFALALASFRALTVDSALGVQTAIRAPHYPAMLLLDVALLSEKALQDLAALARAGRPIPIGVLPTRGDREHDLEHVLAALEPITCAGGSVWTLRKPLNLQAVLGCVRDVLASPASLRRVA